VLRPSANPKRLTSGALSHDRRCELTSAPHCA
jgi:hypothetical protein